MILGGRSWGGVGPAGGGVQGGGHQRRGGELVIDSDGGAGAGGGGAVGCAAFGQIGGAKGAAGPRTDHQGLTLVHFSAQLEPCMTQDNTLHNLNTPQHPLERATQPLRASPIPYKALKLS
jgi:hypothetical protein